MASASIPNPSEVKASDLQRLVSAILKQVSTSESQVSKRKLAQSPRALFPITYQKENAVWAPFVALQNAFNRHYVGSVAVNAARGRYYEPAPGRNLLLGVTIRQGR